MPNNNGANPSEAVERLYADRDVLAFPDLYAQHVRAMTVEGLHDKAEIAIQLAWRDSQLSALQQQNESLAARLQAAEARGAELERERDELRRDCGEAYQVVGAAMLGELHERVDFTDDDTVRALDNLSAACCGRPRPHDDLLPWPKPKALHGQGGQDG